MKSLIANFPRHLKDAVEIARNNGIKPFSEPIDNVVIAGLGGSGIGGTIVSQMVMDNLRVPVYVAKDYFIPGYVSKRSLVIISSYSGNTEETLMAYELAIKSGAKIVAITTGGKVEKIAKEYGHPIVIMPGGSPPRAAFGYSFTQQIGVLQSLGLLKDDLLTVIDETAEDLIVTQDNICAQAMSLAKSLVGKKVIIYSAPLLEGVSLRFKQQINENSKMHAWVNFFPELCHNELVGWEHRYEDLGVVIFESDSDFERTSKRIDISAPMIEAKSGTVTRIGAPDGEILEQALFFIHLGDWASLYLAELTDQDPMAIAAIDHLKSALAKF